MSNSTQKAVTARIDTIFKNHPVGSQDLEPSEKTLVQAGTRMLVSAITPDRFQHVKLLVTPILASDGKTKLDTVYAYQPHVELDGQP